METLREWDDHGDSGDGDAGSGMTWGQCCHGHARTGTTVGTELVVQESWRMSGSFLNSPPSKLEAQAAADIPFPPLRQHW